MYNHKANSVDLHSLEHSKIHGVNIKSYDKSGRLTSLHYIPGIKLHDEVYSTNPVPHNPMRHSYYSDNWIWTFKSGSR